MPTPAPDIALRDGPYVGPRPFDVTERDLFFGREQEARALQSLVVAHRVVLLYAASGAGKTSLLNAGVAPLLADEDGFEVLPPVRMRGLAGADYDGNPYVANLLRALGENRDVTLAEFFGRRSEPVGDLALAAPRALIIDQFEELFTLFPERWSQRSEVFVQIADALAADPLLRVVLAIREDYIAQLDPFVALLPTKLRTRSRLESLRRPAALEAIRRPMAAEGRTFAPGVAERLVDDLLRVRIHARGDRTTELAGELVEPVQLQVICRTLWASLPADVTEITESDLARIGSVSDVLTDYFREAVQAAAAAGGIAEPALRDRLEAGFITPIGTRGTVVGGDSTTAGIPNAAIAEFESRHLVRAEWRAGARWYELTHDSLIGPIVASNAAVREQRQSRRLRMLQRVSAGLAVLAVALIAVLLASRDDGEDDRRTAKVGLIEGHGAFANLRLKRTLQASGAPVAIRLLAGGRGVVVAGGDGRIRIWDMNVGSSIKTLDYGESGLVSADVSPDGSELLVGGKVGLRRWTTAGLGTQAPGTVEMADSGSGADASFSTPISAASLDPTGTVLVVVRRAQAFLMSRETGETTRARLFSRDVAKAVYSPSGSVVAGIGVTGAVFIRDVSVANESGAAPVGAERSLRSRGVTTTVAFSSDGGRLVTASSDGAARLWRTRDGALLRTFAGRGASLTGAVLSPDGRFVAAADRDGVVSIWTTAGAVAAVVRASTRPVTALAFAASDRLLVTGDAAGVVRVWSRVAPTRPLGDAACGAAGYYAQSGVRAVANASGSDGTPYAASATCLPKAGAKLLAPEAGTAAASGKGALARVTLTTADGRRWLFGPVAPASGLGTVAAGDTIATVPRRTPVSVQLWQNAAGRRSVDNLWNPLLFLDIDVATEIASYPGDNASQPTIARWMGSSAQLAGIPPELPVMAGLVESGLKNLNYGDADSAGFFQLRLGIWNDGPYEGFVDRPELQVKWFTDQATAVRRRQIARTNVDPASDPAHYGAWIADTIMPPEQYRGRYQLRLEEARRLLTSAGAGAPVEAAPPAAPAAAAVPAAPVDVASGVAGLVVPPGDVCAGCPADAGARATSAALKQLGKAYEWGGSSPRTGFDTSGLVQWAYATAGVRLPRVTYTQIEVGLPVARDALRRGDLVFFDSDGDVDHVGIYLENDRFVQASHTDGDIRISRLDEPAYDKHYHGARRIR